MVYKDKKIADYTVYNKMRKNSVKRISLKTRLLGDYKISTHIYISRFSYKRTDSYGKHFICHYIITHLWEKLVW